MQNTVEKHCFNVSQELFARHLAAREGAQHVDDLYLAFACAQHDRDALQVFESRHLDRVGSWIAKLREQPSFTDEVRQRMRERILLGPSPKILDYSGRGPLGAWARVTAVREALDLLEQEKARRKEPLEETARDESDFLGAVIDPELMILRQRHLPQFREAFRCALESLDVNERNLLKFHLVDGLNIASIGKIFGKSRATVGRMVIACREKVFEETRARLAELSGVAEDDVRSLMRVLQSQLDVSIRGFLQKAAQ
jgi:RNA polymerase sigma-70 factor (ECF subfamily)